MKKSTVLALLCGALCLGQAQAQEKISIGILPFSSSSGEVTNQADVYSIQEATVTGFVKTRRFTIVDRTRADAQKSELEKQKTEDFLSSKQLAEQGKNLGANYLVLGNVVSASVDESTYTDQTSGKTYVHYKAKLAITLRLVDVETGEITQAETITPSASGGGGLGGLVGTVLGSSSSNPQDAMAKAIKGIEKSIDKFVDQNFPVEFMIADIQEKDKKGQALTLLVNCGTAFGVKKGDELRVVEIVDVNMNGKTMKRRKEIGKLKVAKVEDENFSLCTVKEGGEDITKCFSANAKINVITSN
jgi:curli biogenesis system outer membrane secretion channel CsgG